MFYLHIIALLLGKKV